ncbi:MAG: peptidoglycan DD-metalloendopeptidase family protein [Spirochaetes bacterium]|jgi:murein DD-endopeptidase MepM/ murein hydrolase activator NlpD|nr:peptidoglycan DD-metalloendopeptidase family protein [Spirochaetota bacterium]
MFYNIPINNYQFRQIKFYGTAAVIFFVAVVLIGNIITAIISDRVTVDPKSYVKKEGYPIFKDRNAYIGMVKSYPHDPGVRLTVHKMNPGESLWDVAARARISIDTIVSANPFLNSLSAPEGTEIVVPSQDGVLLQFTGVFDVWRMSRRLDYDGSIRGDYLPWVFKLISFDDMRLAFFRGAKPVVVNDSLEKLYRFKNIFEQPVKGFYTSLFGDRVDPMWNESAFHNGIDILSPPGSPIKPARDGFVIYTGWRDGFGNTVIVQHWDGYQTLYGHCSVVKVKVGDWVRKKDVIALVGSTGRSTGPHLHFTIMRHGEPIDPIKLIW